MPGETCSSAERAEAFLGPLGTFLGHSPRRSYPPSDPRKQRLRRIQTGPNKERPRSL